MNAIHIIPFFERSSALFRNDGPGLDTHHLPTGSFQRQMSTVTNPSPAAEHVQSLLTHLTPTMYSGENWKKSHYIIKKQVELLCRSEAT